MPGREEPRFVVSYEAPDPNDSWQDEYAWTPVQLGQGIVGHDGRRWRVADVWIVYPKRGPFEYGVHAFIVPAFGEDDLLSRLEPDYYGPPAERPAAGEWVEEEVPTLSPY